MNEQYAAVSNSANRAPTLELDMSKQRDLLENNINVYNSVGSGAMRDKGTAYKSTRWSYEFSLPPESTFLAAVKNSPSSTVALRLHSSFPCELASQVCSTLSGKTHGRTLVRRALMWQSCECSSRIFLRLFQVDCVPNALVSDHGQLRIQTCGQAVPISNIKASRSSRIFRYLNFTMSGLFYWRCCKNRPRF